MKIVRVDGQSVPFEIPWEPSTLQWAACPVQGQDTKADMLRRATRQEELDPELNPKLPFGAAWMYGLPVTDRSIAKWQMRRYEKGEVTADHLRNAFAIKSGPFGFPSQPLWLQKVLGEITRRERELKRLQEEKKHKQLYQIEDGRCFRHPGGTAIYMKLPSSAPVHYGEADHIAAVILDNAGQIYTYPARKVVIPVDTVLYAKEG